jgi:glycosyltransferase involved in cell wall biosynthesis
LATVSRETAGQVIAKAAIFDAAAKLLRQTGVRSAEMLSPFPPATHVLTYAQALQGGGVERAMLRLTRGWIAAGHRVTLVLGEAAGPLAAEIPPGVELIELDRQYIGLLGALPALIEAVAPTIIFCPGNHYTSMAAWAKIRLGRACPPIVAKVSNRLDRNDQHFPIAQGYRAWLRWHPAFLDHVVAMSPAMRDEAVRMMGIAPDHVSVIANPPTRTPGERAPGPPPLPGMRFLLGVGRLSPQKRWDRLIDAMPGIAERDTRLLILGEGEERPALETRVGALGLRRRVDLPGYASDPQPALAGAAALVLTSDFEGVPGVLQEALALGTPVVATDSSVAIREIIVSPRQGSIVPAGDHGALVAALDHWLVPGRPRPDPVPERGTDSVIRYLDLFDRLIFARRRA